MITQTESSRRGKSVPMLAILEEALRESPTVEHVVLAPFELDAVSGRAARGAGRLGDAVPPHLHIRHDRHAERRRARPGRLPRLDRPRGRVPGRRARGRRRPLRDRHGLDHGPVDRRRRRRGRRDDRLRGGRARLADSRPALADRRAGARHLARPLADAGARAAPARCAEQRPVVAAHVRDDRRAVEPRAVPLALRGRRRLARADHQLHRRHRGRRVLPLADADRSDQGVLGRRSGARDGDGRRRRRRRARSSAPARSASSSAAARSPA